MKLFMLEYRIASDSMRYFLVILNLEKTYSMLQIVVEKIAMNL